MGLFGKMTEEKIDANNEQNISLEKKVGFGKSILEPTIEEEDGYFGKFLCIHQNGNTVMGILKKVDRKNKLAYFQPSLVGYVDGSLNVEEELPTRINMPLGIIRHLKGTIEEYAEKYNAKQKADQAKKEQTK